MPIRLFLSILFYMDMISQLGMPHYMYDRQNHSGSGEKTIV